MRHFSVSGCFRKIKNSLFARIFMGLILLSLGVIGEYIGKIYLETKGRPRFLIREVLEDEHGQTN